jgi:D-glutamate N-acetyltransferase
LDVVEGQGSIFHPSYAGVSLGLLHGTQPDVIVLCHEAGRDTVLGLKDYPTPGLEEAVDLHLKLARRTNPRVRCAAVSLNTSRLNDGEAHATLTEHAARLRLPVADPLRPGPALDRLVTACLASEGDT